MRGAVLAVALVLGIAGRAAAETPIPPAPTRWVTDEAGMLSLGVRAKLDARLEAYQHATGHQVIVWIGTTTGGVPIEDWGVEAFKKWQLGQKGKDDGVAIFVFRDDHRSRIEVGYGLEGDLPDIYCGRIVHDVMQPALSAGNADAAVSGAVDQVLSRLGGEPNGVVAPRLDVSTEQSGTPWWEIVLAIIGVLFFLGLLVTHPQFALWLLWNIVSNVGRGGFGGGGGGGGDSGFRGGGRSGGGGATGWW